MPSPCGLLRDHAQGVWVGGDCPLETKNLLRGPGRNILHAGGKSSFSAYSFSPLFCDLLPRGRLGRRGPVQISNHHGIQ